jgi:hypothetical protein
LSEVSRTDNWGNPSFSGARKYIRDHPRPSTAFTIEIGQITIHHDPVATDEENSSPDFFTDNSMLITSPSSQPKSPIL